MTLSPNSSFRLSEHVMMREIGGEAVLLDMHGGMYYGLNEVGVEVWKQIEKGASVAAIEEAILAEFDVDRDTVVADVTRIVGELLQRGLIVDVGPVEETGRSASQSFP